MRHGNQIPVPVMVRVKQGALARTGLYLQRAGFRNVAVLQSESLIAPLPQLLRNSLNEHGIKAEVWNEVKAIDVESALELYCNLPGDVSAIVGLGGGKALDVAKYVATLARLPYFALPTSLSQDGFCSPQSSMTVGGQRRSLPAAIPYGLVIDSQVCRQAPKQLTLSGVGDLVAKFTAVRDWKLAFHQTGEPVDDFAALLSDGSVHAFLSHPSFDDEGVRLLATALMMNGIAMVMCGSSRPASGSEHLISHALDRILQPPKLHGLQVGVATYLVSRLQGEHSERIDRVFQETGFWDLLTQDPFPREQWLQAVRLAGTLKKSFHTILSARDVLPEVESLIGNDPRLSRVIV